MQGVDDDAKRLKEREKGVIFKNCAPFTDCISEINNTQIYNEKDIDAVMPIYNLIKYSNNYSKTSWYLWQYFRDEPNDNIAHSELFQFKEKLTEKKLKGFQIAVPLKVIFVEILKCH